MAAECWDRLVKATTGEAQKHSLHMAVEDKETGTVTVLTQTRRRYLLPAKHTHPVPQQSVVDQQPLAALQLQGLLMSIALSTKRRSPPRGAEG